MGVEAVLSTSTRRASPANAVLITFVLELGSRETLADLTGGGSPGRFAARLVEQGEGLFSRNDRFSSLDDEDKQLWGGEPFESPQEPAADGEGKR